MSYQFKVVRAFALDEDVVVGRTVFAMTDDVIGQDEEGHWFRYTVDDEDRGLRKLIRDSFKSNRAGPNRPRRLFRDAWSHLCPRDRCAGAPMFDAIFSAKRSAIWGNFDKL